jgi:hypothetical protein
MKALISTLALAAVIAATTGAQAGSLGDQFRTGFNPGGMNSITDSFRTGFNPESHRSLQTDLDLRHFEGHAKPDSFATGTDAGGK